MENYELHLTGVPARRKRVLQDQIALAADWGAPGWLENERNRHSGHISLRRSLHIRLENTTDTDEQAQLNVELQRVNQRELQDKMEIVREMKVVFQQPKVKRDLLAELMDEEAASQGGEAAEDTFPGSYAQREGTDSQQGTEEPSFASKTRRAVQHNIHPSRDEETEYDRAHALMIDGLEATKLPNDRTTALAYLGHVPDLEDAQPDDHRPRIKLRPAQREALGRWIHISSKHNCFMLSDEMGLGKTVTAVARICIRINEARAGNEKARFLIVTPLPVLMVWERHLGHCKNLRVCRYHQKPERGYSKAQLEEYDVVITTYDIVKNQYMELKEVQRDFEDIRAGHKDFIEREMESGRGKVAGSKRIYRPVELKTARPSVPLLSIEWTEVIVDEAHAIKNKEALRSYALCALKANSRACLTGTPTQNNFWDLFSLFRFMRLAPLDNEGFFKECFIGKSKRKGAHWQNVHASNERVLNAIVRAVEVRRVQAMEFDGEPLTGVPHPDHFIHRIPLSAADQQLQARTQALWHDPTKQLVAQIKRDERADARSPTAKALKKKQKKDMFTLIHESRCDAMHDQVKFAKYGDFGKREVEGGQDVREIASSLLNDHVVSDAVMEDEAPLVKVSKSWQEAREAFIGTVRNTPDGWESDKFIVMLWCLKDILDRVERTALSLDSKARKEFIATNKIIVFGEYLAALDILAVGIEQKLGKKVYRFDGSTTASERTAILDLFEEQGKDFENEDTEPDDVSILLATVKATSEGLTLIHARHVLFVAPGWNPFNRLQALYRAVRVGQANKVSIYDFVMDDSIEKRIRDLGVVKLKRVARVQDAQDLIRHRGQMENWGAAHFRKVLYNGSR